MVCVGCPWQISEALNSTKGTDPETPEMDMSSMVLGLFLEICLWSNQATPLKKSDVLELYVKTADSKEGSSGSGLLNT